MQTVRGAISEPDRQAEFPWKLHHSQSSTRLLNQNNFKSAKVDFAHQKGELSAEKKEEKKKKEKRFAHFLVRSSFQFNPQCCVTIVRRSSPVSLPAINITDYSPITQITRVQAGSELLSVSKTECYQRSFWRLNTQCFVFIALQLMATQGLDTRTTWKRGRQA